MNEINKFLIICTCTPKLANMNKKPSKKMIALTRFFHPSTISLTTALNVLRIDIMCSGRKHLMVYSAVKNIDRDGISIFNDKKL